MKYTVTILLLSCSIFCAAQSYYRPTTLPLTAPVFFVVDTHAVAVKSAQGGIPTSDVVVEQIYINGVEGKHLAGITYSDIVIRTQFPVSRFTTDWLRRIPQQNLPFNGRVYSREKEGFRQLQFTGAVVSELVFPGADVNAMDIRHPVILLKPRSVSYVVTAQAPVAATTPAKEESWIASNFTFSIDGIDKLKTLKIDSFSLKGKISSSRDEYESLPMTISNIRITVTEESATDLVAWFNDFVLRGNNGLDNEKRATLTWLSSDRMRSLLQIEFRQLGIIQVKPSNTAGQLTVEFYSEQAVVNVMAVQ